MSLDTQKNLEKWNKSFVGSHPEKILEWAFEQYPQKENIALACSLSAEDNILLHIAVQLRKDLKVFVLDTGRMHSETYETLEKCRNRYQIPIEVYFPQTSEIESLIQTKGAFSFYESTENRKECCFIRKVEPLQRALAGTNAWITGLRREQSPTRSNLKIIEIDQNQRIKINPLLDWSWPEVLEFAKEKKVPLHPLHQKGYPSIGCQPCTRAIQKGEELRAGRWWWETPENKECGLHIKSI